MVTDARQSKEQGKNLAATPRYVSPRQLVLSGFETPFECEPGKENPWVKLARAPYLGTR